MRSAGLLLVAALVALAPAAQARACFCGSAADEFAEAPSCCCGDASACCCESCPGHAPEEHDGKRSLSGCVCTKTQPQSGPVHQDEIVPAESTALDFAPPTEAPRPAIRPAPAAEGDLRPPSSMPLRV